MNWDLTPAFISATATLLGVLVQLYLALRTHRTVENINTNTNGVLDSYKKEVAQLRRQLDHARRVPASLPPLPTNTLGENDESA